MPGKKTVIEIRGARVNNLKNVSFSIPIEKLTVVTGVSGSGKSSLAFDTVYAEGQRRYVESLSAYARQFLERMEKPDVDLVDGLSPAVAIEQKNPTKTSRSTVGTATEVYDYLRLLWARVGRTFCPQCGREMRPDTVQSASDAVLALPAGTRFFVTFPLKLSDEVSHEVVVENLRAQGFLRVSVDGAMKHLDDLMTEHLDVTFAKELLVVVDRLAAGPDADTKLRRALHQTIRDVTDDQEKFRYNTMLAKLMTLSNTMQDARGTVSAETWAEACRALVLMLAPSAPHVAEELWTNHLGRPYSVHQQPWPTWDEELAAEERRKKRLERYYETRRTWDSPAPSDLYAQAYPAIDTIRTGGVQDLPTARVAAPRASCPRP